MLPKEYRLTKKKDFELVFKNGKNIKGDSFLFKFLKNSLPQSRFGFVVSKKVSPKATVRNKVKRQLRQVISLKLGELKKSFDVVVIVLPGLQKKEFSQIQELVNQVLKKIPLM